MNAIRWVKKLLIFILIFNVSGCLEKKDSKLILANIAPGHFHAALVQKKMYDKISDKVFVYAPEGPEIDSYLASIDQYNTRADNPTSWHLQKYIGPDYLAKMIDDKQADIMITAGNNARKPEYITAGLEAGMHVLSDKPMCIDAAGFERLQQNFEIAGQKDLLLYDIMTERSEITTILQKELSQMPEVFGEIVKGTESNPAVSKESVHHFFKYVSGKALKRPVWYFDTRQQGEGITDVTTHLVDLIQWECFPETVLNIEKDIVIVSAKRWPTMITPDQFKQVTGTDGPFPDFLISSIDQTGNLQVYANGQIDYTLRGIHARVSVRWNYQAPEGAGDTHYSTMRGSRANLIIKQGEEQNYKPELYIQPLPEIDKISFEVDLKKAVQSLAGNHPGIELVPYMDHWRIKIPDAYRIGHEAHFAQVMERFLTYLDQGKIPEWEKSYILAKYFTTTSALTKAMQTSE